jgi:hypothetical protein
VGPIATTPADTDPAIYRMQLEMLGRLEPRQRLANLYGILEAVEMASFGGMRRRFPLADDREIRARIAAQRYGDALAAAAFGWSPKQVDEPLQ